MKSIYPGICLILVALAANSQQLIVEERKVKNEESIELFSWTARLDQDMDYCMETYGSFIKELFKIKVTKQGKTMLVAEKAAIPELSNLRLDQRALFAAETGGTAVSFTFSPGYDIHFGHDAYEEEFKKGELFVKNFVRYHYTEFYEEKAKSTESQIKSKLNDIESNIKKIERNKKTIGDGGDDAKSQSKNEKLLKENDNYASDSNTKRNEISILEGELKTFNESLRKVEAFR